MNKLITVFLFVLMSCSGNNPEYNCTIKNSNSDIVAKGTIPGLNYCECSDKSCGCWFKNEGRLVKGVDYSFECIIEPRSTHIVQRRTF
jgi:hypothetical protein